MPSSKGYIRDYKREAEIESPERIKQRIMRMRARRFFEKNMGSSIPPNMDVDHIKPLSKGGSNTQHNLQLQQRNANRSYPRNKKGGMRSKND